MDITIRTATPDDRDYIASWTAGTFSWGDYIGEAFEGWLEEEHGAVLVAEVDGLAQAVGRIRMVSDSEAWSNAMRVHPDLRRAGIGTAVGEAMWQWANDAGARVIRLAVEDWNSVARGQVTKAGFSPIGDWYWAQRGVGDSSPVPEGNGGQRVKGYEAIKPANSAEAGPRRPWPVCDRVDVATSDGVAPRRSRQAANAVGRPSRVGIRGAGRRSIRGLLDRNQPRRFQSHGSGTRRARRRLRI